MVMWQDITERKAAENAIKDSETRYRQLYRERERHHLRPRP